MDATPTDDAVALFFVSHSLEVRDRFIDRARALLADEPGHGHGSRLARDDEASPFPLSTFVDKPLAAATLILHTVIASLEDRSERYPAIHGDYGMWPLLRAGLGHTATAIYLMQLGDRDERVLRAVALAREHLALISRTEHALGQERADTESMRADLRHLADTERGLPHATRTAIMAAASQGSVFQPLLIGLDDALECSLSSLSEGFAAVMRVPFTFRSPHGSVVASWELRHLPWLVLACLAELLRTAWALMDLGESAPGSA